MSSLVEVDSVEILVVVDNEVDPMSPYDVAGVDVGGQFRDLAMKSPHKLHDRAGAIQEIKMWDICCGAHGLSLMITAVKDGVSRTVLFDTAPTEDVWDQNARKLRAPIENIEHLHLSHWHRDHSGGMLRAIQMINAAKEGSDRPGSKRPLVADLHPARPIFRGIKTPFAPVSLEADPSFEEVEAAGAKVSKQSEAHTVCDGMFQASGFIPRVAPYELGFRNGMRMDTMEEGWKDDTLMADERLLMCNVKGKGLIMFTGCSHAGVINASKCAVGLAGGSVPLYAVIGGFHLADAEPKQIQDTVKDFLELDPKVLLPGHCSGWRVKFEIEKAMPGRLAPSTVGTRFSF